MIPQWLRAFFGGESSLRRNVLLSSNYLTFAALAVAIADTSKAAIFARVLQVKDYGLMALAVMVVGIVESITALGISIMVQRDGEDFVHRLPTYWTMKLVRGLSLTGLTWFCAPMVAAYYREEELSSLIRVLGMSFLLNGITGFGPEVCQREMRFRRVALADGISAFATMGVGLIFLFWLRNVWALVAYNLVKGLLQVVTSYLLFPWRPRIALDTSVVRAVVSFGGALTVVFTANYFMSSFDRGVLGKVAGMEAVGYYAMAYFLAYTPVSYLANVVAPVFLPAFRQIADDSTRMRRAFYKGFVYYSSVFLAIAGLYFITGKYLILVIYGEKWLPGLPAFRILILFGLFRGICMLYASMFFLKERSWLMAGTTVLSAVVLGFCCIPLTHAAGMVGTAWSVVIASFTSLALGFAVLAHLLSLRKEPT